MVFRKCLTIALFWASVSGASDWPQWRGPYFNGSSDEKQLPSTWSQTENIAWSADLPGPAGATPVLAGERVFVSTTDPARDGLKAMCFDRKTGKLLWAHDVAQGVRKDHRSTYAAPSPATDGKLVVFFYGNGQMAVYDVGGSQLWSRNVGPFAFLWTFSSSPVLFQGRLYLQVLQRDVAVEGRGVPGVNESYLLAMDPRTGKVLWRHVRPSDARQESREAFNTPMPYVHQGRQELLVAGGDALTGHDLQTGQELWRWQTWNPERIPHWRLVTSPVAGAGVILACAPKRDPIYAVKAGGQGTLDDGWLAWVSRDVKAVSADVPTPAFYDGDFFVLSDVRKSLSRVEPQTGNVKWTIKTPGRVKYEASPLAADGKIYIINFNGEVAVIDAQDGKVMSVIPMEDHPDKVRSSIIAAHGQLFIRTDTKLFCIGE